MQVAYQLWEGELGRRRRACAIAADAFTPIRRRIHRVQHEGQQLHGWTRSICPNRRRSGRRCCTRRAPPRAAGRSPPPMPSACSSTDSSGTTCATSLPTSAHARRRSGAILATFWCSSARPSLWRPPTPKLATSLRSTAPTRARRVRWRTIPPRVGVDFSRYGPDEPIRFVKTNAMASGLEAITVRSRDTEWTPRKLLEMMVLGSRQAPIVGSPHRVADELQTWVDEADVDGFNLSQDRGAGVRRGLYRPRGAGTAVARRDEAGLCVPAPCARSCSVPNGPVCRRTIRPPRYRR